MPKEGTKSGKKNVYLFFGNDTYSSNLKLRTWKDAFEKKHGGDMNIEMLEGKTLNKIDFESAVNSTPFLAEKRLVIVKDFLDRGNDEEQKKIADFLEDELPDFTVIAFIEDEMPDRRSSLFKKINKIGNLEEFEQMIGPNLTRWIIKKANEKDLAISPNIAQYIGDSVGSDLWNLNNELDKLKSYSKTNQITEASIDDLMHPNLTSTIFKFTDYLAQKNRKKSISTMNILIESGEEIVKILFMIVRHFRILLQVKDLKDRGLPKGEIIDKLKLHPFVVSTMISQCPNFTQQKLRAIYNALLKLDTGMKTGKIKILADDKRELLLAMEKFIHAVCG
jgi:DNA polymerase III subunit delta